VQGGGEALLFEALLKHARERGWLKARGRQRTDSTHVLAAIQRLSRLECVAETLRHALNVLSAAIPDWVQAHVPPEWYERYATRWQDYRLPAGRQERQDLAELIGQDGRHLLALLRELSWTWNLPAVETALAGLDPAILCGRVKRTLARGQGFASLQPADLHPV